MKKILLGLILLLIYGCDESKNKGFKYCEDIIPLEVIINDFEEFDENGTKAIYKISARVKICVQDFDNNRSRDGGKVIYRDVPQPKVDKIDFLDKTDIIDQDRGVFTSVAQDSKTHYELRKRAAKKIMEIANSGEMRKEARRRTEDILKAFYKTFNHECEIKWSMK